MGRSIRLLVCALLVMTTVASAAAQSHGDVPPASTPAATAPPGAAAPAQAGRRRTPQPRRNRQLPIPAEKRWAMVWPTPDRRVVLIWPSAPTYRLSWDDHSETPAGATR